VNYNSALFYPFSFGMSSCIPATVLAEDRLASDAKGLPEQSHTNQQAIRLK
jgi:hypothetical protein